MAKDVKFQVSESLDAPAVFVVFGVATENALVLKHPYPDFEVQAGWVAKSGSTVLTFTGPREGQKVPCSRG